MLKLLPLLDFDALFLSDPDSTVVPCGADSLISTKQAEEFMSSLFKEDNGDLNFVSSCSCGALSSNALEGKICSKCKTEVTSSFAGKLKFKAWLEIPEFMPPIPHPVIYRVFKKWMGPYKGRAVLDILLDATVELPDPMKALGIETGLHSFYDNFDKIVQFMLTEYKPLTTPAGKRRSKNIPEMVSMYRKQCFVRYIPVLNQALHLINRSGSMTFTDIPSTHIIKTMVEISNSTYTQSHTPRPHLYLEQHMHSMYYSYLEYVSSVMTTKLIKKPGFIRKCVLGSRCHFSFRGVIVPIPEDHRLDELYIPWRVGVSSLKLEIINLLINRYKITPKAAMDKVYRAHNNYDADIDDIMKVLIEECPYPGLPTLFGRNPTLNHGSIQLFYVTKIKSCVHDNTISMSPLVLSAPNADFDGDAMYGIIIREMKEVEHFLTLHPSTTLLGEDTMVIGSAVNITVQQRLCLHHWLFGDPDDPSLGLTER